MFVILILKLIVYLKNKLFSNYNFWFFYTSYSVYAFPVFSKEYKDNFLKKHAHGYDFVIKINEIKSKYKIDQDENILYSIRLNFGQILEMVI